MGAMMTKVYDISPKQWLQSALAAIVFYLLFQCAAFIGQFTAGYITYHSGLNELEKRISLDIAYLDVGNQALNTPLNEQSIRLYIDKLNSYLGSLDLPLKILAIQGVKRDSEKATGTSSIITLITAEQDINIVVSGFSSLATFKFAPYSFFAALLVTPFFMKLRERKKAQQKDAAIQTLISTPKPKLIIDLQNKTIGNGVNNTRVTLPNKPLCFYTALVKYCIEHPNQQLIHHQDVPAELVLIANRVFGRLIELGHTKRKRPDFNANLDKTLSEIRAALDEVYAALNTEKERYYPPRAQGEGSRSKQHSYALTYIAAKDVEFIGI
jgi:hypothetical protein